MGNNPQRRIVWPVISILVLLIIVLAIVAALRQVSPGWWLENDQQNELQTYENMLLGIAFEYPSDWGEVGQFAEKGCLFPKPDAPAVTTVATSVDQCENIVLKFALYNGGSVNSASRLFVENPNPREGLASDTFFIKDQSSIERYCDNRDKTLCSVYTNRNGIMVAKFVMPAHYSELNGNVPDNVYYFIKSERPDFPGISFESLRESEEEFDRIVDSVRFVSFEG